MDHEYTELNEGLNSSKYPLPLGSICDILNIMFKPGDQLQLYVGAEPYKEPGSFLASTDDLLIWLDSKDNVSFQHIGGNLGIRKIGNSKGTSSESKKKTSNKKKQSSSTSPSDKKETSIEDTGPQLAEVEDRGKDGETGPEESSVTSYFTFETSKSGNEELIEEVKKKLAEVEDTLSKEND